MIMNNAAANATVRIATLSRTFSLLDFLLAGARGAPVATPAAACPELAGAAGACCSGNGATSSAYNAPPETHWIVSPVSGEDFWVARTYTRRCRY
jgi:hypothetical protein